MTLEQGIGLVTVSALLGVAVIFGVALLLNNRKGYRHRDRISQRPVQYPEALPVLETVPPSKGGQPMTRYELLMKQFDCPN
jgi:hypothetical protein